MAKRYIVANNTGKGFITHEHRNQFNIEGYPLDIWVLGVDGEDEQQVTDDMNLWVASVSGTTRTQAQAQALLDAESFVDEDDNPITITLP